MKFSIFSNKLKRNSQISIICRKEKNYKFNNKHIYNIMDINKELPLKHHSHGVCTPHSLSLFIVEISEINMQNKISFYNSWLKLYTLRLKLNVVLVLSSVRCWYLDHFYLLCSNKHLGLTKKNKKEKYPNQKSKTKATSNWLKILPIKAKVLKQKMVQCTT